MSYKTLYIKTTGSCNLDCKHCFTGGKGGDKTHFNPEKTAKWVKDYIDATPDAVNYHLELHGGEPFLVPVAKLKQFVVHFKDNPKITIGANTNLTYKLTDEILDFIQTYLGSSIGTSWDPWIRWANDKQYQLWLNNMKLLRSLDVSLYTIVSVSKRMTEQTPDWLLDQLATTGATTVSLERLTLSGNAERNPDVFPDNEVQDYWYLELVKRYQERKADLPYNIRTLDTLIEKVNLGIVKTDTNCRNCEQNLVTINSNGTLGGCPNVASEHKHATLDDSVQTFLVSDGRVNEIVKELNFNDPCYYCDVFDICGGDCHRLPWQGDRCGGLKHTLRYLSGRVTDSNIILKVR